MAQLGQGTGTHFSSSSSLLDVDVGVSSAWTLPYQISGTAKSIFLPRACCCYYTLPTFRPLHNIYQMICERVQAHEVMFIVIMWELMDESATISGLVTKGTKSCSKDNRNCALIPGVASILLARPIAKT